MIVLRLYQSETCWFCSRVLSAARRLGVTLELRDVDRDPELRRMLQARRGRATVPVLGIVSESGEELLGESSEIIRYLEEHVARERGSGRA